MTSFHTTAPFLPPLGPLDLPGVPQGAGCLACSPLALGQCCPCLRSQGGLGSPAPRSTRWFFYHPEYSQVLAGKLSRPWKLSRAWKLSRPRSQDTLHPSQEAGCRYEGWRDLETSPKLEFDFTYLPYSLGQVGQSDVSFAICQVGLQPLHCEVG